MSKIIDTHVHLWNYVKSEFPWIQPADSVLARNFTMSDYYAEREGRTSFPCVVVQARQVEEENSMLCQVANSKKDVVGVIGWVNMLSPSIEEKLSRIKENGEFKKIVGFRHLVQDELDVRFMLRPEFIRSMVALGNAGFVYDVLIRNTQFGQFRSLLQVLPESKAPKYVLDHMGKPKIGGTRDEFAQWKHDVTVVARSSNVFCKISGLLTEMKQNSAITEIQPYIETVFDVFGADRLMLGSDWPVCTLRGELADSLLASKFLESQVSTDDWDKISNLTAQKVYGLPI